MALLVALRWHRPGSEVVGVVKKRACRSFRWNGTRVLERLLPFHMTTCWV